MDEFVATVEYESYGERREELVGYDDNWRRLRRLVSSRLAKLRTRSYVKGAVGYIQSQQRAGFHVKIEE